MAPKRAVTPQTSAPASGTATPVVPAKPAVTATPKANNQSVQEIVQSIWSHYLETTPQRTLLLDVFMAFLVLVGGLQFLYCVIGGNYPFNAFLSGFSATVGQFVLTASLRMQTNTQNKAYFGQVSPERAFADFIFGSMILHFFCINFIN